MEEQIGKVIHYYDKISVAVIKLDGDVKVGDQIHVKGKSSDFEQTVESMQLEHKNVDSAAKNEEVAIKFDQPAKEGDAVYKKS